MYVEVCVSRCQNMACPHNEQAKLPAGAAARAVYLKDNPKRGCLGYKSPRAGTAKTAAGAKEKPKSGAKKAKSVRKCTKTEPKRPKVGREKARPAKPGSKGKEHSVRRKEKT